MKILILPGDGIGPEIAAATERVLEAAARRFAWRLELDSLDIGFASLRTLGTTMPEEVLRRVPQADGVVMGPVSVYQYPPLEAGGVNPSATMRKRFDLYANVRPCRARPGLSLLRKPMDLIIVRENTEGFYADRNMFEGSGEFMPDENMALAVRKVTAKACRRVAQLAFELAAMRRSRVTAVHKANVLRLSDGLFLREVREVAASFPAVTFDDVIVDAAAALLIRTPERFDVIVTTNMFGDILSDEASELSGSLGLGGAINASDSICVAQAQHGSAPDIAGLNVANPTSLILSSAGLLDWRGKRDRDEKLCNAARAIEAAVDRTLADPASRTRDIGGNCTTAGFGDAVCAALAQL